MLLITADQARAYYPGFNGEELEVTRAIRTAALAGLRDIVFTSTVSANLVLRIERAGFIVMQLTDGRGQRIGYRIIW